VAKIDFDRVRGTRAVVGLERFDRLDGVGLVLGVVDLGERRFRARMR